MKKLSLLGFVISLLTAASGGLATAASSPIVNGSFQTGDFTGWTLSDSTHCRFDVCGNGTDLVQLCSPAAPGDSDGHCAALSGSNVWISQGLPSVNYHQYTFGACMKHSGLGTSQVNGAVSFSLSGDTGWVCQTKTINNPYGVQQRLPAIGASNAGGTAYVDQFTFTINKQ